jgi:hypothetical protein
MSSSSSLGDIICTVRLFFTGLRSSFEIFNIGFTARSPTDVRLVPAAIVVIRERADHITPTLQLTTLTLLYMATTRTGARWKVILIINILAAGRIWGKLTTWATRATRHQGPLSTASFCAGAKFRAGCSLHLSINPRTEGDGRLHHTNSFHQY